MREANKAKRRRHLLDDVPLGIRAKLAQEAPDLEEEARILKAWRQRDILNGTSRAIQEKIEERRRKKLLAGPYEKSSEHDKRSATVIRPSELEETRADDGGVAAVGDAGPPREESNDLWPSKIYGETPDPTGRRSQAVIQPIVQPKLREETVMWERRGKLKQRRVGEHERGHLRDQQNETGEQEARPQQQQQPTEDEDHPDNNRHNRTHRDKAETDPSSNDPILSTPVAGVHRRINKKRAAKPGRPWEAPLRAEDWPEETAAEPEEGPPVCTNSCTRGG